MQGAAIIRRVILTTTLCLTLQCSRFGDFWKDSDNGKSNTTQVVDTIPPSSPATPNATGAGSNQIDLTWTTSTDDITLPGAIVYEICQSTTAGICATFTVAFTSAPGAAAFSATPLSPSTTYYYRIRARDAAGNVSGSTAEVSAATSAPGTVNTPVFAPVAGVFNATQNVAITSSTPGATICYTTNATTPTCDATPTCTTGSLYGGAVSVPSTATLKAVACKNGNIDSSVATGVFTIDTLAPFVTNVTSSTADGAYISGQAISIQVTFSEVVNVTGTPQLGLATGSPLTTMIDYASGSGSNTLTFTYTVANGNNTADLDYDSTNALTLNGGTITDAAANAAILTLVTPGIAGSLGANKNIVVDGTIPAVTNVSASTADGTYGVGSSISIQVFFDEAVNVTGSPTLNLATGTPSSTTIAYASGSGSTTLVFTYTVAAGNASPDLDYFDINSLSLNGGTIRDAALNNAALVLPATGSGSSLGGNKAIVIDGVQPIVSNVTSLNPNSIYTTGAIITVRIQFSETVYVGGTPQLTLSTGSPAATAVNYVSGGGSNTLSFSYTVAAGNNSFDLDYNSGAALGLNGGSIQDASGNQAVLNLPGPGGVGSLGWNKAIVIDAVSPVISAVAPGNGSTVIDTVVSYTLSENCQSGNIIWSRTGGSLDGAAPHTQALVGAELNSSSHNGIIITNNPPLVPGTIYSMQFNCTDAAGNVASPVNVTGINFAPPGSVWSTAALPGSLVWTSVAYGSGLFVASSDSLTNTIATSPNGTTWTGRVLPSSDRWNAVTYGGGKFVIVAESSNASATSTDGITWTPGTLPSTATWITAAYGSGVYVAIALSSNMAATSTDGITWTARTLPVSAFWLSVTYGNGTFVAVSASASSIAATSPDGITWTQRTMPVAAEWKSVGFGNGIFVALGQNSTIAATSADGITWTQRTLPSSQGWQSIAYGNGVFAAPANGGTTVITSPDGITWTSYNSLPSASFWTSIAFGGGVFATVANSGANAAITP